MRAALSRESLRALLPTLRSLCTWLHRRGDIATIPPFPTVSVDEHGPCTLIIDPVSVQEFVPFLVAEGLQGGRDLNGDGDAQDAVLHVLSLRTGATQNSGLSGAVAFSFRTTAGSNGVEGARIAIPVDEGSQGFSDLDGDGNRNGFVLHIFDARRRAATNLRLPVSPLVYGGDGFLSVAVPESAGARDLNGDGDTLDEVLHLVDIESGAVANARKAVEQFFDPAGVAFPRSDRVQRRLGDTEDGAIEVEDPRAGGAYTFRVSEARNGNVDLNGDGDTIDFVMHGARLEDRDRDGRFDFADDCIGSSRTCPR